MKKRKIGILLATFIVVFGLTVSVLNNAKAALPYEPTQYQHLDYKCNPLKAMKLNCQDVYTAQSCTVDCPEDEPI